MELKKSKSTLEIVYAECKIYEEKYNNLKRVALDLDAKNEILIESN